MPVGRPRKPTNLLQLSGTWRADRHANPANETRFRAGDATCPFDATAEPAAAAEWNRLAPELLRLGLLTIASRNTLILICRTWADVVACDRKIAAEGLWVEVPVFSRKTGEQVGSREEENLAVSRQYEARALYNRLLNEFGGNPSSASKVASQKKPAGDKPGNSFANKFLLPS